MKMAGSAVSDEFNVLLFEKKLQSLKDSQESINSCCHWCLENRQHHKKIVSSWLNVLKHAKVEQRLTLFYLANDVIQYSKRKNYEFVESWSTSLQKATPLVRDEKVKHKILRIFTIWQQRGVYGEEFITDLSGLISASPPTRKNEEPHEFESQYLITKIRNCSKLEAETDCKLKKFKEHNPKILMESENNLFANLKDRAHVDDVEKEINDYVKHMENYIASLKSEIKARSHLISLLTQADTQLEKDKKDVKLVANAYKSFATRVKNLKKKLDELKPKLESPLPSPDINAPSPEDSEDENSGGASDAKKRNFSPDFAAFANPGFYNPVAANASLDHSKDFTTNNNGFSSFMGANAPFNLSNLFTNNTATTEGGVYSQNFTARAPPPPPSNPNPEYTYQATNNTPSVPLAPPPIPIFNKNDSSYQQSNYGDAFPSQDASFNQNAYDPNHSFNSTFNSSNVSQNYPNVGNVQRYNLPDNSFNSSAFSQNDEYNPEDQADNWDTREISWNDSANIDSPASPVSSFDYDSMSGVPNATIDRDLRVLPVVPDGIDEDDSSNHRPKKDVDHRNLISLTGSPHESINDHSKKNSWMNTGNNNVDRDYRTPVTDKDYRIAFNVASLNLPPPPPPPRQGGATPPGPNKKMKTPSPRKMVDKVEIIDMELSDDDVNEMPLAHDNLRQVPLMNQRMSPPPPFPEFPDDLEANMMLNDDMNNDHRDFDNRMHGWAPGDHNGDMEGPMMMQGGNFRGRNRNFQGQRGDYRNRGRNPPNWGFRGRGRDNRRSNRAPRGPPRGGRPFFRGNAPFRQSF